MRAASLRVGGHHGTAGTCSIRIVHGPDSFGQVTDCIAMVAKVSYKEAKQAAIDTIADYNPAKEGMTFKNAKKAIRKLGLKCERRYDKGKDWKDLPDLAIVAVAVEQNRSRAVVFVRENGKEFICDSSNKEPVLRKDYPDKLDSDDAYIKIISQSHGGSGSSHLGGHSDYPVSHQGYGGHGSSHLGGHSHYPVSPSSPPTKDDSPQNSPPRYQPEDSPPHSYVVSDDNATASRRESRRGESFMQGMLINSFQKLGLTSKSRQDETSPSSLSGHSARYSHVRIDRMNAAPPSARRCVA